MKELPINPPIDRNADRAADNRQEILEAFAELQRTYKTADQHEFSQICRKMRTAIACYRFTDSSDELSIDATLQNILFFVQFGVNDRERQHLRLIVECLGRQLELVGLE